jgi:hypothetical protein
MAGLKVLKRYLPNFRVLRTGDSGATSSNLSFPSPAIFCFFSGATIFTSGTGNSFCTFASSFCSFCLHFCLLEPKMLSSALSLRLLVLLVLMECSLTEVTIFVLVSSFLASRDKLVLCEGTILHVGSSVGVIATSFLPRNDALISDALKEDRPGVPLAGAVCDFLVEECAQVSNCGPYGPKVRTASTGTRPLGLCDRPGIGNGSTLILFGTPQVTPVAVICISLLGRRKQLLGGQVSVIHINRPEVTASEYQVHINERRTD